MRAFAIIIVFFQLVSAAVACDLIEDISVEHIIDCICQLFSYTLIAHSRNKLVQE